MKKEKRSIYDEMLINLLGIIFVGTLFASVWFTNFSINLKLLITSMISLGLGIMVTPKKENE